MTNWPQSEEFQKHSENVRVISKELLQIRRIHKSLIRKDGNQGPGGQGPEIRALSRLHYLTLGIWAEALLRKILTDPTGFNDLERRLIWGQKSQESQWLSTMEFAARRHFWVPMHRPVDETSTEENFFSNYVKARIMFEEHVNHVIRDRNTLAHGQWAWKLKSGKNNEFTGERQDFESMNYKQLFGIAEIIQNFNLMIQTLAVSGPTFQRDFDSFALRITEAMNDTSKVDYAKYVEGLKKTNRYVSSRS